MKYYFQKVALVKHLLLFAELLLGTLLNIRYMNLGKKTIIQLTMGSCLLNIPNTELVGLAAPHPPKLRYIFGLKLVQLFILRNCEQEISTIFCFMDELISCYFHKRICVYQCSCLWDLTKSVVVYVVV